MINLIDDDNVYSLDIHMVQKKEHSNNPSQKSYPKENDFNP